MKKGTGDSLLGTTMGVVFVIIVLGFISTVMIILNNNRIDDQARAAFLDVTEAMQNPYAGGVETRVYQFPLGNYIVAYSQDSSPNSVTKKYGTCKSASCVCLCADDSCDKYVSECKPVFGMEFSDEQILLRGTGKPEKYTMSIAINPDGKRLVEIDKFTDSESLA